MIQISTSTMSESPELDFQYIGGDPALDFINTADWTERGPEKDRVTDFDRFTRWAEGAGILTPQNGNSLRSAARARPREAEAALRKALQARGVLQRLFSAIAKGEKPDDSLEAFNRMLSVALEHMRVVSGKEKRSRQELLRLTWPELGENPESVIWPILWSAASLLVSPEAGMIRTCCGENCGWMYVDRSRNRFRRWCQMSTCGTREKSRRRYERARTATRARHRHR
jgi:predicted RNA-binding Zn ribbon-like protein